MSVHRWTQAPSLQCSAQDGVGTVHAVRCCIVPTTQAALAMCVSGYDWLCVCLDMTGYVCVWI